MPFDPIDFEVRDYVPNSGWPISYADLEPFYIRANAFCEAGAFAYTTEAAFGAALPVVEGFASADFEARTGLRIGAAEPALKTAAGRGLVQATARGWRPTELGSRFLNDLQASFLA